MSRRIPLVMLGLVCALALAGCGKKPGLVDSPRPEGQVDPFPRPYPNPALDPKPGQPDTGVRFP